MNTKKKSLLLIAMPFAGTTIPSIQLPLLKGYLKERNIDIETKHLYLKAAEIYGISNYNFLIYNPNESYTAQMVFSKYVFPKHWNNNIEKFRKYFNKHISNHIDFQNKFSFDDYLLKTDLFYKWVLKNLDWKKFDIIGFTLNYGQFLPSLALAKEIKKQIPEKKIILGGSRTTGRLGLNVLNAFNYIDFIVSGDGEDALFHLLSDFQNYESISHLIYRKGKEIIWNREDNIIDLNCLPTPDFDSFFKELNNSSEEVKQYFHLFGRLPVEISRGCWWNKCSFCSQKVHHTKYREKKVDKIVDEIQFYSDKYMILSFQLIGNTLPKKDYIDLLEKIKKLDKDLTFFTEARAGELKNKDYALLKEAGFNEIQIGIETFSSNYIKKMNKGVKVIDNIAALKFCKENDIKINYNIIINYPNEESIDFEENKKNTNLLKQYLEPPQISFLAVEFGSNIFNNFEKYNIEKLEYTDIDKIMYPNNFLEKKICFIYNFKRKKDLCNNNWKSFVDDWKNKYYKFEIDGLKRQTIIDKFILYYLDGKNYLKIYDKRDIENIKIYILNNIERKIFLSCLDIISLKNLHKKLPDITEKQLNNILESFEKSSIVFREDDRYLSLPLCYDIVK